jgi:hypothetical protein
VKVTSQFPEEVCFMATKSRFYNRQQNIKICLYKTKVASIKNWLMNLQKIPAVATKLPLIISLWRWW